MSKTFDVVLGGQTYTLKRFNLQALEELATVATQMANPVTMAFTVLRLALRTAEPKLDLEEVTLTFDEVQDAAEKIMIAAGLKKEPQPGEAQTAVEGRPSP